MSVAIQKVIVPRFSRFIASGQVVKIGIEIVDEGINNNTILLNPTNRPTMTLYDPNGVVLANEQILDQVAEGSYQTTYQTDGFNILGVHTAVFTAINNADVAKTALMLVFKIIKLTTFPNFTYLVLKDQTGVIWYYYVDITGVLVSSTVVPTVTGFTSSALTEATYWLAIENAIPSLRYVYPNVTGDLFVSTSQPVVGTGYTGLVTFTATNGNEYIITLDVTDGIIMQEV